ncbi:CDP-diacylglycerol--glycerol-3-phosphate 3-phosphatidyltransferase [Stygiomarasmius scandens]|uniref:CDP-diacylglycerol--glycerol-3-phosphate 3-phosphatidyltransferase n=1 Tax=Marasmiellus scandens TaxID=2682957 RepID=A0ABR1JHR2_9AGAR
MSTAPQVRYDSVIRDFTSELSKRQPSFSVPASGIRVLSHPKEFYSLLLDMIRNAEDRVFLSSLYIGSGESELVSALKDALERKASLQVHLQLDLNRSTRPGASSTAKILLPLLRSFPDRMHVSLFRSPSLRGVMAKLVPPRFNEGWGTWHAKIYGADNSIIISGANLNEAYFTNRQDRYLHFKQHASLANYCFDFLQAASSVSYRLLPADSPDTMSVPRSSHSYTRENYTLVWSDQDTHPHHFNDKFRQALSDLQTKAKTLHTQGAADQNPHNAILLPVIQGGQFNIREEQEMFELLFKYLKQNASQSEKGSRPLMDLTSGYFGLSEKYQDLVLGCPDVDVRIVAASPKANGFFGSKGISGRIPEGYTYLEQRFMKAVEATGREWSVSDSGTSGHGVQLSEWEKDGWTYHAKGLWLSPTPSSNPVLTLFGSSNLNSRSAELDTELSFVMVLPSSEDRPTASADGPADLLRAQLADEIHQIRKDATGWKGGDRKVRLGTKLLVKIVGGML